MPPEGRRSDASRGDLVFGKAPGKAGARKAPTKAGLS
jgi:hypothetical protein